ncbi:hypothetical protein PYCC9005_004870 [Savitreella phatthalungensis]
MAAQRKEDLGMDSALESIGARCSACHRQDFLPFRCARCGGSFCLDHAKVDTHTCKPPSTTTAAPTPATKPAFTGPSLKQLQAEHVARATRPIVNDHAARRQQQTTTNNKAKSLLDTFRRTVAGGAAKTSTVTPPTTGLFRSGRSASSAKVAAAWKQEARGDVKIGVDRRVWVRVGYMDGSVDGGVVKGRSTWVDRDWSVGRALDAVAREIGVKNVNSTSGGADAITRLHLVRPADGAAVETSQPVTRLATTTTTVIPVILYRGKLPFPLASVTVT